MRNETQMRTFVTDSSVRADARFEVLGSPYSLLSVTLSASQKLYTRRGTLVAVAGKPDNVRQTLQGHSFTGEATC